ncbi:MAG TPA: LytTR family DNA-binding domain-containing protein [Puia sp.]|nr:LytTR family DNA-binding domain-containing protein [Puia sp.]
MIKVLLIEDEKPSIDNLVLQIHSLHAEIKIAGITSSVKKSIEWLQANAMPDLIISDIRLNDGICFTIFQTCAVNCPIIFVTAFDKYLLSVFEFCSIDYILKPLNLDKLAKAIEKYNNLKNRFLNKYEPLSELVNTNAKKRSRIIVRKRGVFQAIKTEDVVCLYTNQSLVYLIDRENSKLMVDAQNLSEVYEYIDHQVFFKANRQYIVNINFVKNYKKIGRSQISLEILPPYSLEIIVSQNNTSEFRKWIREI